MRSPFEDQSPSYPPNSDNTDGAEFLDDLIRLAASWKQREGNNDESRVASSNPMNGKNYVKYLEASYGGEDEERLEWVRENILKGVPEALKDPTWSWQFDPKYDAITVRFLTIIISEVVFYPFLETLPPSIQSVLKHVVFGVLPIRAINAHTCRAPNGDPVVIVDAGLLAIAGLFDRVSINFRGIKGKRNRLDAIFQVYQSIINFYHTGELIHFPSIDTDSYNNRGIDTLISRTLSIYTFVMAHELAHIYAGHLEKSPIKSIVSPKGIPHRSYQLSHEMEYEADEIAWKWYIRAYERMPALRRQSKSSAATCPLVFFLIASLLDKNLGVPDQYSSHPSAVKRLQRLIMKYHLYGSWRLVVTARTMPTTEMMNMLRVATLKSRG